LRLRPKKGALRPILGHQGFVATAHLMNLIESSKLIQSFCGFAGLVEHSGYPLHTCIRHLSDSWRLTFGRWVNVLRYRVLLRIPPFAYILFCRSVIRHRSHLSSVRKAPPPGRLRGVLNPQLGQVTRFILLCVFH